MAIIAGKQLLFNQDCRGEISLSSLYNKLMPLRSKPRFFSSVFKPLKNKITSFDPGSVRIVKKKSHLVLLTYIASAVLAALVIGLFLVIIVFAYFSRGLPNPNQLLERSFELSTRFYDRNNSLLYEVYGDKNRTLIKLNEISPDVIHATLATEDAEFYTHQGYSPRGMLRAVKNIFTNDYQSDLNQDSKVNSLDFSNQIFNLFLHGD